MKIEYKIALGVAVAFLLLYILYRWLEKVNTVNSAKLVPPQQIIIFISNVKNNGDDIRNRIEHNKPWFNSNFPAFRKDLEDLIHLYDNNLNESAVFKAAKIIENFFKYRYSKTPEFKKWRQDKFQKERGKPRLERYIQYAMFCSDINEAEFDFINGLRKLRNEEAHIENTIFGHDLCAAVMSIFLHITERQKTDFLPLNKA